MLLGSYVQGPIRPRAYLSLQDGDCYMTGQHLKIEPCYVVINERIDRGLSLQYIVIVEQGVLDPAQHICCTLVSTAQS